MREIVISLTQKQKEFDQLLLQVENVLYGGAKGGGKSHGLREIMLKRRFRKPGSRGVIFRKTYPELYGNHIDPILTKFPLLRGYYNSQHKEIKLPNGSILAFRHCQYERDLGLHQGQEYNDLAIEEIGEWPENWFLTLKGSNRSSREGIPVRCLLTGNPGGIGHKWLKRLFIDRKFRAVEKPESYGFVPARVYDNPFLMKNDPDYINRLQLNRNQMLVKAYLEGSWDIQAGQYFDMVSREAHFVRPFEIPDYWERFGMFDHGYNHPAFFIWIAVDTDGVCYVYREMMFHKKRTEEIVNEIMEFPDSLKLSSIPAGWDCWAKHGTGPSVDEKFSEASGHRLVLHKANIDRVLGAAQVRDYLHVGEGGPRLRIFETCPIVFETITRMMHDTKNPEDVLKIDATPEDPDSGDDAYDCLRYGLMSRPRVSVEPEKPKKKKYYDEDDIAESNWQTV